MQLAKFQAVCPICDTTSLILFNPEYEATPDYCPFCGGYIDKIEQSDEDE